MKLSNLILSAATLALLISGCGPQPTPPPKDIVDTRLPTVSLNGHIEDLKSVAFEWKSNNDPELRGIYVYRNDPEKSDQMQRYATINNRFATHYVDKDVKPDTTYKYFFTTFSQNARSENSETVTVHTLALSPVVWIQSIQNMPRSVKIIWRIHTNPEVDGYIIERKSLQDDKFQEVAHLNGRLNAEYIDTDLKDGQVYKYRVRAVTFNDVISTPSAIVQAVTKHLPPDVTNFIVTNNLPKKIRLSWQPTIIKDFAYYKIYRDTSATGSMNYYAKVTNPEFIDDVNADGAEYFYKVTVVDEDGLESDTNVPAIQGLTLAKPKPPALLEAKIVDNKALLKWSQVDPRTTNYTIIKTTKTGWLSSKVDEIRGVNTTTFTDPDVFSGVEYTYQIVAVDKNGIESEPSMEVHLASDTLPPYVEKKEDQKKEVDEPKSEPIEPKTKPSTDKSNIKAAPDLDTSLL